MTRAPTTQLSFADTQPWRAIPSPKLRREDNRGVYAWAPMYAAFSERFALEALQLLGAGRSRPTVVDPFSGGGTSVVASTLLGLPVIGVDLDPFSALLSRARVAVRADSKKVETLLRDRDGRGDLPFSDEARQMFRASDLRFAAITMNQILNGSKGAANFSGLLADPEGKFDSEVVALTAVVLGAMKTARVVRGSNPVWFRHALPGEVDRVAPLRTLARAASVTMLRDLSDLSTRVRRPSAQVLYEDFRTTSIASRKADILLTSPPYLNRLDYVVNHLGAISLLSGIVPESLDDLRRRMIGTTKVVDKEQTPAGLGPLCRAFLEQVSSHPSKASSSYYYWTYLQYFKDMHISLANIARIVRPGGAGAMVLQNSFYKEIPIPVAEIVIEMAALHGIRGRTLRAEVVRAHLGKISPGQSKYVRRKVLEESVLVLDFPD